MDILSTKFNFNSLSVKDLVEARDLFHVHLINKKNVVATAVGRYRIRKNDPWPNQKGYSDSLSPHSKRKARTLDNSEVREYSWPCLLVFVSEWEDREALAKMGQDDLIPRCIYMPDGRIVPICVVEAPPSFESSDTINTSDIIFPVNYVGGGFPIIVESQGVERIASIGCVVTDGNKYYALTNRHVTGEEGTPVYTQLKGVTVQIGWSSEKQLSKIRFEDIYGEWKGKNIFINNDIGLVEITDQRYWKTDVFGIGEIERVADLNTGNISLSLIAVKKPELKESFPKVCAFGAVSGRIRGEIIGLFYRYKSLGGLEYVSDFLIGGPEGTPLNIHHGDSGTLWLLEDITEEKKKKYYPFALHWGQHDYISAGTQKAFSYGLATNLTNACVKLDVDIVRGWNLDNEYSWGKTGHFKIAAKSCELTSNTKLSKLLMANQKNIGYVDSDLINKNVVSGSFTAAKNKFVPLADVADIIWRSTRKLDSSNHFADIDESNPAVENGKTLLELCSSNSNKHVDIDFWIKYFGDLDQVDPQEKKRDGALPFRVWQMYNQMVASLKKKNLAEFICAGGTMAHYVGDACQPLHISHLHHGRNAAEEEVHSIYETDMVDKKMNELFKGINQKSKKLTKQTKLVGTGKEAAVAIIQLMKKISKNLPPEEICDSFSNSTSGNKLDNMWNDLGTRTIKNIADGCHTLAVLWQSAWIAGNGDAIAETKLKEIPQADLKKLYNDKTFVPSFRLKDPLFKALMV